MTRVNSVRKIILISEFIVLSCNKVRAKPRSCVWPRGCGWNNKWSERPDVWTPGTPDAYVPGAGTRGIVVCPAGEPILPLLFHRLPDDKESSGGPHDPVFSSTRWQMRPLWPFGLVLRHLFVFFLLIGLVSSGGSVLERLFNHQARIRVIITFLRPHIYPFITKFMHFLQHAC